MRRKWEWRRRKQGRKDNTRGKRKKRRNKDRG